MIMIFISFTSPENANPDDLIENSTRFSRPVKSFHLYRVLDSTANLRVAQAKLVMVEVPGSVGTTASLSLRLGQMVLAFGALLFMTIGVRFYQFTAFCFLVTIMSVAIPWNLTLAMVDIYFVLLNQPFQKPRILLAISIGDWVVSILVLASASSAASVVDILQSGRSSCPPTICNRYQFAATLAFLTWFLSLSSSLFNLWLLPSLI